MLYGLFNFHTNCMACYESGYFRAGTSYFDMLLEAIKKLNLRIRPQALNIIESFPYPDEALHSAIGNSYGDIYEAHLEWAQSSRQNQTKQGDAIADGFLENMLPILKAKM